MVETMCIRQISGLWVRPAFAANLVLVFAISGCGGRSAARGFVAVVAALVHLLWVIDPIARSFPDTAGLKR